LKTPLRILFRTIWGSAILCFIVGASIASWEVSTTTWVREFQAGAESPMSERVEAVVQRSAIEGLGFGLLALLIGSVAWVFTRRRDEEGAPRRLFANILTGAGAFATWTWCTWVTDAALPFLRTNELILMNLVGLIAMGVGVTLWVSLSKRLPWATKSDPAAHAIGSLLLLALAITISEYILLGESGGFKSPKLLGMSAGVALIALLLGAAAGRTLEGPLQSLEAGLAKLSSVFRTASLVFGFALVACVTMTWSSLELSSTTEELDYDELTKTGERPGPNVVLVTIDTLRADHLGCYGYERPTSPFMDTLAAEGTLFADASAPAAWTKPSTGTILTGLYPSRHGALYHGSSLQVPEGERTLAEAFNERGYATAGFVSNPNVKKVFEFDRGFEEFFDSPVEDTVTLAAIRESYFGGIVMKLSRHQFNWKYENDIQSVNRHVLAWLESNRDQPFFLYVHYIDPHIPYTPPEEYEREFARNYEGFPLFNERKRLVGIDRYDGEIRYTDDGMRSLVEKLDELGIRDETIIVITSDHGEEFFEHEVLGHGFSLYQPVIHVPLIANGPGVAPGRVVETPVQIVDLAATVLDLAGADTEKFGDGVSFADSILGENWRPNDQLFLENEFGTELDDNRSFVLNAVRDGKWKLILTERNLYRPPGNPRYGAKELYDLEADPDETNNLIHVPAHQKRVAEMINRLELHEKFLINFGLRGSAPDSIDPEVEAEMRALGYLGDE